MIKETKLLFKREHALTFDYIIKNCFDEDAWDKVEWSMETPDFDYPFDYFTDFVYNFQDNMRTKEDGNLFIEVLRDILQDKFKKEKALTLWEAEALEMDRNPVLF